MDISGFYGGINNNDESERMNEKTPVGVDTDLVVIDAVDMSVDEEEIEVVGAAEAVSCATIVAKQVIYHETMCIQKESHICTTQQNCRQ